MVRVNNMLARWANSELPHGILRINTAHIKVTILTYRLDSIFGMGQKQGFRVSILLKLNVFTIKRVREPKLGDKNQGILGLTMLINFFRKSLYVT